MWDPLSVFIDSSANNNPASDLIGKDFRKVRLLTIELAFAGELQVPTFRSQWLFESTGAENNFECLVCFLKTREDVKEDVDVVPNDKGKNEGRVGFHIIHS